MAGWNIFGDSQQDSKFKTPVQRDRVNLGSADQKPLMTSDPGSIDSKVLNPNVNKVTSTQKTVSAPISLVNSGVASQQGAPANKVADASASSIWGTLSKYKQKGDDFVNASSITSLANAGKNITDDPNSSLLNQAGGYFVQGMNAVAQAPGAIAQNTWNKITENPTKPEPSISLVTGQPVVKEGQKVITNPKDAEVALAKTKEMEAKHPAYIDDYKKMSNYSTKDPMAVDKDERATYWASDKDKPTPSSAAFPNQPGVSAMTPEQFTQRRDQGEHGIAKRPSEYLKPILHAALLAKPGTQQALDAHDAFNMQLAELDKQSGYNRTPVDPKTGQTYSKGEGLIWKDGTPVNANSDYGAGFSGGVGTQDSRSGDARIAHDAETARLAQGTFNGQEGDAMRNRAPEGLILNPRYQNGFGSSRYNDTPGANSLPDDAYITPAQLREKQNIHTFTDVGANGQHVPGMIAHYDGQGGLVGMKQYDASPEAQARNAAANEANEAKWSNPLYKEEQRLANRASGLRALADKYGDSGDEVRAQRAETSLASFREGPLAKQHAAGEANKTTLAGQQIVSDSAAAKDDAALQAEKYKIRAAAQVENRKILMDESKENAKLKSDAFSAINSFIGSYDKKDQEDIQSYMANMVQSGQVSLLALTDPRTAIPLMRAAVRDSKMAKAESDNYFSANLNPNAPINYRQGYSTLNDNDEDTKKRLYEDRSKTQAGGLVNG